MKKLLFIGLALLAVTSQHMLAQTRRFDATYTTGVISRNKDNVKVLNELKNALNKELNRAENTRSLSDSLFRKEYSEFRDCLPVYKYRLAQYVNIETRIRLKLKKYGLMNDQLNFLYAENAIQALRNECTLPNKQLPSDYMWSKVKYRFELYKAVLGEGSGNFYLETARKATADGNTSEAAKLMGVYVTGTAINAASKDNHITPGDYKGLTGKGHFLLNEWTLFYYRKAFQAIEDNMEYISKCYIPSADRLEMYNQQMEDCEELYTEIKKAFYLNNIKEMHINQEDIDEAMKKRSNIKGIE